MLRALGHRGPLSDRVLSTLRSEACRVDRWEVSDPTPPTDGARAGRFRTLGTAPHLGRGTRIGSSALPGSEYLAALGSRSGPGAVEKAVLRRAAWCTRRAGARLRTKENDLVSRISFPTQSVGRWKAPRTVSSGPPLYKRTRIVRVDGGGGRTSSGGGSVACAVGAFLAPRSLEWMRSSGAIILHIRSCPRATASHCSSMA